MMFLHPYPSLCVILLLTMTLFCRLAEGEFFSATLTYGLSASSSGLLRPFKHHGNVGSPMECAALCSREGELCKTVEFNPEDGECALMEINQAPGEDSPDTKATLTVQTSSWPWVTLLRVERGTGVSVFDLWTSGVPFLSDGVYCNGAAIAEKWDQVSKVKLSMEASGVRVMEATFDATLAYQSTSIGPTTSWFTLWRSIQNTTYTDMYPGQSFNQFYIEGVQNPTYSLDRRFWANHESPTGTGCPGDKGWFMVMDTEVGFCAYETDVPGDLPKFIYCPGPTACHFLTDKQIADTFVIEAVFK